MKTLTLLLLSVVLTAPAWADPIVFTDRAAFDAAAGATMLISLDHPHLVLPDPTVGGCCVTLTYEDLLRFHFDYPIYPEGPTLGWSGLGSIAEVLVPVTAFGFDFLAEEISGFACADSPAACRPEQSGFLGFWSDTPFHAQVEYGLFGTQTFTLSNIAIQAVPEPATLWLLGAAGMLGLIGWLGRAWVREWRMTA